MNGHPSSICKKIFVLSQSHGATDTTVPRDPPARWLKKERRELFVGQTMMSKPSILFSLSGIMEIQETARQCKN